MRVWPLVVVLLLPGCVEPPSAQAPPPSSTAGEARVLPWGLEGCEYIVGMIPVEPSALEPHLPEGFVAVPFLNLAAGTPADRAILGVEAFVCERGATLDGESTGMEYGSFWTSVRPPEELAHEDASLHTVRWDTLVPDAPRREALAAAGLPARAGSAEVRDAPGGREARYELDGVGAMDLSMTMTRRPIAAPPSGIAVEFMPAEGGGLAVWRADYAWEGEVLGGHGHVTLPEGSWPAEVAGGARVPAQFHAGRWSFTNGSVTLPG